MRFLTDENIAKSVVQALRKLEFDVKDIKEERLQGTSDEHIIQLANREDRIIITHDKDFGDLLSNQTIRHKGVILVRLKKQGPDNTIRVLSDLLRSDIGDKIKDNILVVSETKTTIHTSYSRMLKIWILNPPGAIL